MRRLAAYAQVCGIAVTGKLWVENGEIRMKRILMLGGSMQQIPAIKKARELGYYTITCDYLPENPGHKYANEYHNVSTTDKEGVLELARTLRVDGIVAYASDPAAPTAAYVAEKLGLPTSPYVSVEILCNKDRFRTYLSEHGFSTPKAKGFSSREESMHEIGSFRLPVMVKPVDSSGCKGVNRVDNLSQFESAVEEAFAYSRQKRIIVEEFVKKKGYQISGDVFSVDGKLAFYSFGNELYSDRGVKEYVALGEFWPSLKSDAVIDKLCIELQRLITSLGMKTTAYNIEAIEDERGEIYLMEVGPRNGGSYIPQLIELATGVDMVEYTIKGAVGDDVSDLRTVSPKGFFSNYMIMSKREGRFDGIWYDPWFRKNCLIAEYCVCSKGEPVHVFENTAHSLGTILFKADSLEKMQEITSNMDDYFRVKVESET